MLDVLAPESAIVARLVARLPSDVPVLTATDLDGVTEQGQWLPAVHVLFGGVEPRDTLPDAVLVTVTWSAVVCVRNDNSITGEPARRAAGPLIAAAVLALHAFEPGPDWSPLEMSPGNAPLYDDGAAYFPLSFTTAGAICAD